MIPDVINIAEKKAEETIRVENLAIILETAQGVNILSNAMRFPGNVDIFNLPATLRKPLNQAIIAFSENHPVRAKHIAKSIGVFTTPASETVLRQLGTTMPALKPFTENRIQKNKKYAEENGWQQCCGILILELSVLLMSMFTSPKVDKVIVGIPCFVIGSLLCIWGIFFFASGWCARRQLQRNGSEHHQRLLDLDRARTVAMFGARHR